MRATAHADGPWWRPGISTEALIALVSLYFLLVCNGPFWAAVRVGTGSTQVLLSLGVAVFALHAFLLGLLCWGRLARPLLALLLVVTALAHWYMTRYAVVLDAEMIRNVLQTDMAESRELLTFGMLLHTLLLGVLPAVLVLLTRPKSRSWQRGLLLRLGFVLAMVLLAAGAVGVSSQGVFALMRTDKVLRYKITPGNYIVSLVNVLKPAKNPRPGTRQVVGADAHRPADAATRKPRLLVVAVGETVRGDHWGLNGYTRQTTPELARRAVVNFPDVTACGTSTEVALPCMFSLQGREHYDRDAIRGHESVLDVAARAGVQVLWRDNQSGCKGICIGVQSQTMGPDDAPGLCAAGRCFDEILLAGLPEKLQAMQGDVILVLHMLGNHGPNYFERYPPAFERWTPVCKTPELNRCSQAQIANAYDNAILYSDAVLGRVIDLLQQQTARDAAMLYVSDHGESLGEYGLYLHGAPYAVAPRPQLHVPMVLWLSPGFAAGDRIDMACLRNVAGQPASHDNLFATVLGAFDVQTSVYHRNKDLLAACRTS
ncbi:MAG: phosphoethanolamine transferase [Xanthomonadaceae bacterium]|nr:phosphoethanolamine transferase [Xanthomonadaceae bacterium]